MRLFKTTAPALLLAFLGCSAPTPDEVILMKAQEVVRTLKEIYVENALIEPVRLEDFSLLDMGFYQQTRSAMEQQGLRYLGDLEYKHLTSHDLSLKTCIQVYSDREGTVSAGVWNLHRSPKVPAGLKAVELETEFSDGYWITTRNQAESKMRPDPEGVTETIAPNASITELIQIHNQAIQKHQKDHPNASMVKIYTLTDLITSQKRQALQEARYRAKIHGITEKELQELAPQMSRKEVRKMLNEIHRLF